MQLGMVGLGRMGGNMARRLIKGGHEIVGYAADPAGVKAISGDGGIGTTTLEDFVRALRPPRVAWVMVPAGAATEQVVTAASATWSSAWRRSSRRSLPGPEAFHVLPDARR
jgi:6-phosphogluconate dehydrogenase